MLVTVALVWVALLVLLTFMSCSLRFCSGFSTGKQEGVQPPISSSSAAGRYYEDVVLQFETAGFTNVQTRAIEEQDAGWFQEDGDVKEVSVNGDAKYSTGDCFPADAKVVIAYYSYEERSEDEDVEPNAAEENEAVVEEPETNQQVQKEAAKPAESKQATASETVENPTTFEYAYISKGGAYDVYYLFDEDTKTEVDFTTDSPGDLGATSIKIPRSL